MQMNPETPRGPKGEVRSVFMVMILNLVTCGIYGMIWFFKMSGEINAFLGVERISPIKVWLLSSVTCGIYGLYFMFVDGKEIVKEVQAKAGLPPDPPFIAGPLQIQGAINKVWEAIP
jgi:hypothetical protein